MKPSLLRLKAAGFAPSRVLDVGCEQGAFSLEISSLFPGVEVVMIDAEKYNFKDDIPNSTFIKQVISNEEKSVDWYSNHTSGDSIYKEVTPYYANIKPTKREAISLDSALNSYLEKNLKFDLIKLDVQGSEIDVIEGGTKVFSNCEALILEIPFCGIYNKGSPDFYQYMETLRNLKFYPLDLDELHYFKELLVQIDILFVKKDSPIFNLIQEALEA